MDLSHDLRVARGRILNVAEVLAQYPVGTTVDPWNMGSSISDDSWIDEFLYFGFRKYGSPFLRALEGRFACCYWDGTRNVLFLARDWIGESPMHFLATSDALWVSNTIANLRDSAADGYLYEHVRAFPHACWQEIDFSEARQGQVDLTMRPGTPECFYDFRSDVADRIASERSLDCPALRSCLLNSVSRRVHPGRKAALLLSGGLDSLSVALLLKAGGIDYEAFTLSVGEPAPNGDPARAIEYAKQLGIRHELITVETHDLLDVVEEAVGVSETYHLYNIYCAVGMILLARTLKDRGFDHAFCGEGFNEAVGDYKDWVIKHPRNDRDLVLQRLNSKKLSDSSQRLSLVWGPGRDNGRYNRQLGAGLAKHAGSRMFKPFMAYDLALEAPLLDRLFLRDVVALEGNALRERGGKPWLVDSILRKDLRDIGITEDQVRAAPKVRLQDAGSRGRGGLSPLLFGAGYDQRKLLEMFNRLFGAHLAIDLETQRLRGGKHGA